jgi:hypothetical protein
LPNHIGFDKLAPNNRRSERVNTEWIRGALTDRGLRAKDLAKAWDVNDAVITRFIHREDDAAELTRDRAISLARLLGIDMNQLQAQLGGGEKTKAEFTWYHAELIAERFGITMQELYAKIGSGPINW